MLGLEVCVNWTMIFYKDTCKCIFCLGAPACLNVFLFFQANKWKWWSLCSKWLHHRQKLTVVFVTNTCCSPSIWLIYCPKVKASDENDHLWNKLKFTPFTGSSFINDSLLQRMLHVNHPLLQLADITNHLLSTAALFSRFCSHGIQIWAIKAASYIARWIPRYHVQYMPLKSEATVIFKLHNMV